MLEQNTITLNDRDREAINAILNEGEFSTPEEAVHAGLALLQKRQKKIEALRKALKEGEESGYIDDFSFDKFLAEMRRERSEINA